MTRPFQDALKDIEPKLAYINGRWQFSQSTVDAISRLIEEQIIQPDYTGRTFPSVGATILKHIHNDLRAHQRAILHGNKEEEKESV